MHPHPAAAAHRTHVIDPFGAPTSGISRFINAVLATALFRCWHLITFFTAWATCICLINNNVRDLSISSTLLTVLGTVLGFVISYRTSSSFERYNEGRRLWASVILASRTFSRFIWFHVPETWSAGNGATLDPAEQKARTLIEKKTTINLVEAFSVAVKHYLRGEDGIYYEDLYHLVKFLPPYALPAGLPMDPERASFHDSTNDPEGEAEADLEAQVPKLASRRTPPNPIRTTLTEKTASHQPILQPARIPPQYSIFDVFPFSLLVRALTKKGRDVKGKKAAKERLKRRVVSHNIPLEITHYLSSYIASLQQRKHIDPPTANSLITSLNMLTDSLTGLERVLTTPIPFSYSVHLWTVTTVYVFALPFQLWKTLEWVTIPATAIASFFFFGFLVAGEEIENPFGYDKNDLNLDHFTHSIIRLELQSLTSRPMPDIADWAFSPFNDRLFGPESEFAGIHPEEWVRKGAAGMMDVMEKVNEDETEKGERRASKVGSSSKDGGMDE